MPTNSAARQLHEHLVLRGRQVARLPLHPAIADGSEWGKSARTCGTSEASSSRKESDMFRVHRTVLLSVFCVAFVGITAAQEIEGQKIKGWGTVFDPEGDARATLKDGAVELTVPGAYRDLWPIGGRVNAPRILRPVKGDFTVHVKVASAVSTAGKAALADLPAGSPSSRGATLIVWHDENNFIRFERACYTGTKTKKLNHIWFYNTFDRGKRIIERSGQVDPEGAFYLWIARKMGTFYAYYHQQGDTKWTQLETHRLGLPDDVQVGVSMVNTTTEPFTVRFEDFKVGNAE